jgi:hypothetical protein
MFFLFTGFRDYNLDIISGNFSLVGFLFSFLLFSLIRFWYFHVYSFWVWSNVLLEEIEQFYTNLFKVLIFQSFTYSTIICDLKEESWQCNNSFKNFNAVTRNFVKFWDIMWFLDFISCYCLFRINDYVMISSDSICNKIIWINHL